MTFNFTIVAPPDAAPPPVPPPAPKAKAAPAARTPSLVTFALDGKGKLVVLIPKHRNTLKPTDLARVQNFQKTKAEDWRRLRLEWLWVLDLARQGKVLIDADAKAAVLAALDASVLVPLHPLAKEQSIAWLADKPLLKAKRSDFNLGLIAGKEYPAEIESVVIKDRRIDHTIKSTTGVVKARATIRKSKRLQITVRGAAPKPYIWLEGHDKPDALFELFEVASVEALPMVDPKRLARARAAVEAVNEEHKHRWPVRGNNVRGLTDWQMEDASLAVASGRALLAWEMGLGKAQPVSAKVLTPVGWRRLGDLRVGDEVIGGSSGKTERVKGVFPQGQKAVFRVGFNDGGATLCCDDHLWQVTRPGYARLGFSGAGGVVVGAEKLRPGQRIALRALNQRIWRVLPLKQIREKLFVKTKTAAPMAYNYVPLSPVVEYGNENTLPVDPYLLGALLGDGGLIDAARLTAHEPQVVEECRKVLPPGCEIRNQGKGEWRIVGSTRNVNPLLQQLAVLGLRGRGSADKFVPDVFMRAMPQARLALLQGLMDTDGYVTKTGDAVQFSSTSCRLADAVVELVQSLGGVAWKNPKRSSCVYKGERKWCDSWVVGLSMPSEFQPFRLKRKVARAKPRMTYKPSRTIAAVTPVGQAECVCISVSDPRGLYITDDFAVTHNTAPGGMVFASALVKMGAPDLALFIVPQDLIPQWIREARKFFGRVVQRVDSAGAVMEAIRDRREGRTLQPLPITARELRDLIRQKKAKGWYIIHYEAVSRSGRREIIDDKTKDRLLWAKSGYSSLTTAFKQATVVIDECTRAQGQETFISQAIRGIRAKYRLGLTGTPVRNYLVNIFWLLWWCIGNRSIRFPYSYAEGQKAFLRDFGTQEKIEGETSIRQVPEPGNLLLLRRILAPSVIRRRVDEIGLPVNCRYITVPTPWGLRQKEQYANWLDPEKFEEYWRRKFPYTNLKPGEIRKLGAALGQFSHLEYATTCPESESEDFGDPAQGKSNWTPKLARALDIIRKHVKNGERVLFGSSLVPTVPWVAERLREVGHKVECLTERDKNGKHVSLGPAARADAVLRFVASGGQVLCASMNAMALGHNLDMVSTVVVAGLPWDLATFEQFLARVRRFSSKRDISVYVLLTEGSLDEKKWELLQRKRAGAARALDIVDFARDESHVSLEEVLAELVARGVTDGPVVDELSLQRLWEEHAKGGSVVLSTDSIEMEPTRRGRRATFYQMTLGAPEPRPEPSAAWRAIYELSGALSAGYRVPFNSGHQAGIDPRTKLFVLVDRSLRVLATGPAYEVAACAGKNFTPREITLACRLARMGPADRNLALGWWKQGLWQTELVPEDAVWWQKGSWQAELEAA